MDDDDWRFGPWRSDRFHLWRTRALHDAQQAGMMKSRLLAAQRPNRKLLCSLVTQSPGCAVAVSASQNMAAIGQKNGQIALFSGHSMSKALLNGGLGPQERKTPWSRNLSDTAGTPDALVSATRTLQPDKSLIEVPSTTKAKNSAFDVSGLGFIRRRLLCMSLTGGAVRVWDTEMSKVIERAHLGAPIRCLETSKSSEQFRNLIFLGLQSGNVAMYDLRKPFSKEAVAYCTQSFSDLGPLVGGGTLGGSERGFAKGPSEILSMSLVESCGRILTGSRDGTVKDFDFRFLKTEVAKSKFDFSILGIKAFRNEVIVLSNSYNLTHLLSLQSLKPLTRPTLSTSPGLEPRPKPNIQVPSTRHQSGKAHGPDDVSSSRRKEHLRLKEIEKPKARTGGAPRINSTKRPIIFDEQDVDVWSDKCGMLSSLTPAVIIDPPVVTPYQNSSTSQTNVCSSMAWIPGSYGSLHYVNLQSGVVLNTLDEHLSTSGDNLSRFARDHYGERSRAATVGEGMLVVVPTTGTPCLYALQGNCQRLKS